MDDEGTEGRSGDIPPEDGNKQTHPAPAGDITEELPEDEMNEEDMFSGPSRDHMRFMILGNSGSGKTVYAWYLASKAPAVLFINPQKSNLPGFTEVGLDEYKERLSRGAEGLPIHLQMQVGVDFDIEEFVNDWHTWASTEGAKLPYQLTLVVDEISLFGVRSKLSAPPWLTTVLSRSRIFYNVVVINHSTYQMPNWAFNQCTYVVFMRTGSSAAEKHYQGKWFTPLADEFYRNVLSEKYNSVIYNVNDNEYYAMGPIEL